MTTTIATTKIPTASTVTRALRTLWPAPIRLQTSVVDGAVCVTGPMSLHHGADAIAAELGRLTDGQAWTVSEEHDWRNNGHWTRITFVPATEPAARPTPNEMRTLARTDPARFILRGTQDAFTRNARVRAMLGRLADAIVAGTMTVDAVADEIDAMSRINTVGRDSVLCTTIARTLREELNASPAPARRPRRTSRSGDILSHALFERAGVRSRITGDGYEVTGHDGTTWTITRARRDQGGHWRAYAHHGQPRTGATIEGEDINAIVTEILDGPLAGKDHEVLAVALRHIVDRGHAGCEESPRFVPSETPEERAAKKRPHLRLCRKLQAAGLIESHYSTWRAIDAGYAYFNPTDRRISRHFSIRRSNDGGATWTPVDFDGRGVGAAEVLADGEHLALGSLYSHSNDPAEIVDEIARRFDLAARAEDGSAQYQVHAWIGEPGDRPADAVWTSPVPAPATRPLLTARSEGVEQWTGDTCVITLWTDLTVRGETFRDGRLDSASVHVHTDAQDAWADYLDQVTWVFGHRPPNRKLQALRKATQDILAMLLMEPTSAGRLVREGVPERLVSGVSVDVLFDHGLIAAGGGRNRLQVTDAGVALLRAADPARFASLIDTLHAGAAKVDERRDTQRGRFDRAAAELDGSAITLVLDTSTKTPRDGYAAAEEAHGERVAVARAPEATWWHTDRLVRFGNDRERHDVQSMCVSFPVGRGDIAEMIVEAFTNAGFVATWDGRDHHAVIVELVVDPARPVLPAEDGLLLLAAFRSRKGDGGIAQWATDAQLRRLTGAGLIERRGHPEHGWWHQLTAAGNTAALTIESDGLTPPW